MNLTYKSNNNVVYSCKIQEFYCDSNGNAVANPKNLEQSMRKPVREQRKLSRKQKGSNNCNK